MIIISFKSIFCLFVIDNVECNLEKTKKLLTFFSYMHARTHIAYIWRHSFKPFAVFLSSLHGCKLQRTTRRREEKQKRLYTNLISKSINGDRHLINNSKNTRRQSTHITHHSTTTAVHNYCFVQHWVAYFWFCLHSNLRMFYCVRFCRYRLFEANAQPRFFDFIDIMIKTLGIFYALLCCR